MTAKIIQFPVKDISQKADILLREAEMIYVRSMILVIEAIDLQLALLRMWG